MVFKGIMKNGGWDLYNAEFEKLRKECDRRGISADSPSIAKLRIAYAEGYNIGKSEQNTSCPLSNQKKEKYIFTIEDEHYFVSLTEDQERLLDWLYDHDLLYDLATFEKTDKVNFDEI